MLTFEFKKSLKSGIGDELEIHADIEGLRSLISQLRLLEEHKTDHIHLMSESWGGSHLADQPQDEANRVVHHVKIALR